MPYVTAGDGTPIYYKDWGQGRPIVFSHGWPLSGDDWDYQMMFFGARGFRVIAHDRRGHGRSGQTWDGNDMDTYAADLSAVLEQLDLRQAVLVGFSMGSGEIARYLSNYGTDRIARAFPRAQDIGFESEMAAFGLNFCHGLGLGLHERPIISRLNLPAILAASVTAF